jgi:serine/threonine/tyrosine-interacting protein
MSTSDNPRGAHSPVQEYVYRIPGPPSVWIPSPIVDNAEELSINGISFQNYESAGFTNADFLKKVTYDNFNTPGTVLDWNYQERWSAQAVLPFLYLGPVSIAKNGSFLQQHAITMILNMRTVLTSGSKSLGITVANPQIRLHTVDVGGMQDLIAAFPRVIEMINAHLSTLFQNHQRAFATSGPVSASPPGKVLVCCETGNEHSPCLVAAYLMAMYAMDFIKAIQIVQAQRFSAIFGQESRNMLQTFHTILQAKRSVFQSDPTDISRVPNADNVPACNPESNSTSWPSNANKRSLDELYTNDMDSDTTHISELGLAVGRREGHAPFQDSAGC